MTRPPFRIDRLRIENFRGIDKLELKFTHETDEGGLVVLAGDNGCGKTAVLEAILLGLGQAKVLPDDTASAREQIRFGAENFRIELQTNSPSKVGGAVTCEADLHALADPQSLADPETYPRFFMLGSGKIPANPFWRSVGELHPAVVYYSARRSPEALGRAPDLQGTGSSREGHRLHELKRRLLLTYMRSLRQQQPAPFSLHDPFERIQQFTRRFFGEEYHLEVYPARNDPSSEFDIVIRIGPAMPRDITSIKQARLDATRDQHLPTILPIDRLSSGQLSLFSFAGPLIFRDTPADIVLIDEPEQHMHPSWQKLLLGALRELSPQSQFIVATHSMDILESAMNHERHLLLRDDDPRARDWKTDEDRRGEEA